MDALFPPTTNTRRFGDVWGSIRSKKPHKKPLLYDAWGNIIVGEAGNVNNINNTIIRKNY